MIQPPKKTPRQDQRSATQVSTFHPCKCRKLLEFKAGRSISAGEKRLRLHPHQQLDFAPMKMWPQIGTKISMGEWRQKSSHKKMALSFYVLGGWESSKKPNCGISTPLFSLTNSCTSTDSRWTDSILPHTHTNAHTMSCTLLFFRLRGEIREIAKENTRKIMAVESISLFATFGVCSFDILEVGYGWVVTFSSVISCNYRKKNWEIWDAAFLLSLTIRTKNGPTVVFIKRHLNSFFF